MMNVTITSQHLPGGWDFYCGHCDLFFSVYQDKKKNIKHCPACGREAVIKSPEEFEKAFPDYQARRAS